MEPEERDSCVDPEGQGSCLNGKLVGRALCLKGVVEGWRP